MKTNCTNCKHCWEDASVGHMECTCEEMTEDEMEKYFTNAEDGCPRFEEIEDTDYPY